MELGELAVAWLLLAGARVLIAVAPFGVIRRLLGDPRPSDHAFSQQLSERDGDRADRVARSIDRSVRRTPWRADCYPQALTARALLRVLRIPHTVSFGLRRDESGAMVAHAWVRAGDRQVTGGDAAAFVEVGTFSWPMAAEGSSADDDVHLLRALDQQRDPAP